MPEEQANIQLEMNFNMPSGNRFRRCLERGVFTVLFEHAAPGMELSDQEAARRLAELEKQLLGCKDMPVALALTDRNRSDNGRRAVEYAALLPEKNRNAHLVYLSGRNTSPEGMRSLIAQAVSSNISNLAAVSGESHPGETARTLRGMEFCDSVNTLRMMQNIAAPQRFFPGAAVLLPYNPFW